MFVILVGPFQLLPCRATLTLVPPWPYVSRPRREPEPDGLPIELVGPFVEWRYAFDVVSRGVELRVDAADSYSRAESDQAK
jgi:hypothetical protein